MRKKPWSGRFAESTDSVVEEFNQSLTFDQRLFRHDIKGSVAHAALHRKAGVISAIEEKRILTGLRSIEREIEKGSFRISPGMEDIHMAIESRLIEKAGPSGGKLHTGRSRNDQVSLDIRMYLKDEIFNILSLLHGLKAITVEMAEANIDSVMPGYTHLQRAQPVLFGHHLLAYYEMFKRDTGRLLDCLSRLDEMPLGSGALAGSAFNLDRHLAARLLGFSRVTENSVDAVSDRDFIIEFLGSASILMMHLSRLSEELIIWSAQEFSFVEFSDAFSTGSSIMPQKKNPDVAELARGKTGRVYGDLVSVLVMMKGLPLAYNKDMQEDKEPLFDAIDTVKIILKVFCPMLKTMKVKRDAMLKATGRGFINATDAADYLVKKGVPFREAHGVTGKIVAYCLKKCITLEDLNTKEWQSFSPLFNNDIKDVVSMRRSINSRDIYGGTALRRVKERLKAVKEELKKGLA